MHHLIPWLLVAALNVGLAVLVGAIMWWLGGT